MGGGVVNMGEIHHGTRRTGGTRLLAGLDKALSRRLERGRMSIAAGRYGELHQVHSPPYAATWVGLSAVFARTIRVSRPFRFHRLAMTHGWLPLII
jgi:hypothetical protein